MSAACRELRWGSTRCTLTCSHTQRRRQAHTLTHSRGGDSRHTSAACRVTHSNVHTLTEGHDYTLTCLTRDGGRHICTPTCSPGCGCPLTRSPVCAGVQTDTRSQVFMLTRSHTHIDVRDALTQGHKGHVLTHLHGHTIVHTHKV